MTDSIQQMMPIFWPIVFIFGTMIGSFLNVVIGRVPEALLALNQEHMEEDEESGGVPHSLGGRLAYAGEYLLLDLAWSAMYLWRYFPKEIAAVFRTLVYPPSHCVQCNQPVKPYDNIPVISWFWLKGHCRFCKTYFSSRYPINEVLTGLLFIYAFWQYGMSPTFFMIALFFSALQVIFWIDLDHQFIFNVITYPCILLGFLYNLYIGTWEMSLIGILVGFVFLESVALLSIIMLGKEGMGGGDVKLAMMLGAWLGVADLTVALVLSFVMGALIGSLFLLLRKESKPFPFGPALALGGFVAFSIGELLRSWYINAVIL